MDIIGDHITLEPISARLFTKGVSQEIHKALFSDGTFLSICFADEDHKEHSFKERDITMQPESLVYYHFRLKVDPTQLYPFLTLTFDLSLAQTEKVRASRATSVTTNPSITIADPPTTVGTTSTPQPSSQTSESAAAITSLLATPMETPRALLGSFASPDTTHLSTMTAQSPAFALNMHRTFASNTIFASYYGLLNFLDSQELFDAAFPFPDPMDTVAEPKKSVITQLT
jgi:hypothetical protein